MDKRLIAENYRTNIAEFTNSKVPNKSIAEDISKKIHDFLLPSFLYSFYSDKSQDIEDYAKKFTIYELLNKYPYLQKRINKFIENINQECFSLKEFSSKDIHILGDIHPNFTTKYSDNNFIYYYNNPNYSPLIDAISKSILPKLSNYFPKIHEVKAKNGRILYKREFVEVQKNGKENDIKEYYYNLGYIIPFLLFIRNTDSNQENILIDLPYPKFFDMECIFLPKLKESKYSILSTGLVKTGESDRSALTGGIIPVDSLLQPVLCGSINKPYIKWILPSKGKYNNLPYINNERCMPQDFIKEIESGYKDGSVDIIKNLNIIKDVILNIDVSFRIVLKPTKVYVYTLLKSLYPQSFLFGNIEENIKKDLLHFKNILKLSSQDNLLQDELNTINQCCIPVYYSNGTDTNIYNSNGNIVAELTDSPYRVWDIYADKYFNERFLREQLNTLESLIG